MSHKRNKEIFIEEREEFEQEQLLLRAEEYELEQEFWAQYKPEAIIELTQTPEEESVNKNSNNEEDKLSGESNTLPF